MSGFLTQLTSFFSPTKKLNPLNAQTTNNSKQPISPSNKPIGPTSNSNPNLATKLVFGGKRKSLKRKNKKNNKTKRR